MRLGYICVGACSIGNLEAARRVSFLFPICLGRSKETLLAGYGNCDSHSQTTIQIIQSVFFLVASCSIPPGWFRFNYIILLNKGGQRVRNQSRTSSLRSLLRLFVSDRWSKGTKTLGTRVDQSLAHMRQWVYTLPISFPEPTCLFGQHQDSVSWDPQRSNECACLSRARARGNGLHHFHRNKQRQNGGRFKFRGMCFISRG